MDDPFHQKVDGAFWMSCMLAVALGTLYHRVLLLETELQGTGRAGTRAVAVGTFGVDTHRDGYAI